MPRKPLREIAGKTMIARVYEAVAASKLVSQTIVATDAREVVEHCEKLGIPARMTSPAHRSGTDRVHEIAGSVEADVYINVQGDEPLTRAEHLDSLVRLMQQPGVEVGTLKIACAAGRHLQPQRGQGGLRCRRARALFFPQHDSLRPRPRGRSPLLQAPGDLRLSQAGAGAFCSWPESGLERIERLEQLRFLENGVAIHVAETSFETIGVDTEEDLRRVERILLDGKTLP